ncbi:MAG: hypothetical protein ACKOPG_11065 [Novosphingobium sp.]
MTDKPDLDPFALARSWMAQWEKAVNERGTEFLAKPEAAQAMQALSGAALQAQAAGKEASARMLAAANLPSRADIEALGGRIAAVEASLARIEGLLRAAAPAEARAPARPAVRRTRKPPA